jgi:hypothetical protein
MISSRVPYELGSGVSARLSADKASNPNVA